MFVLKTGMRSWSKPGGNRGAFEQHESPVDARGRAAHVPFLARHLDVRGGPTQQVRSDDDRVDPGAEVVHVRDRHHVDAGGARAWPSCRTRRAPRRGPRAPGRTARHDRLRRGTAIRRARAAVRRTGRTRAARGGREPRRAPVSRRRWRSSSSARPGSRRRAPTASRSVSPSFHSRKLRPSTRLDRPLDHAAEARRHAHRQARSRPRVPARRAATPRGVGLVVPGAAGHGQPDRRRPAPAARPTPVTGFDASDSSPRATRARAPEAPFVEAEALEDGALSPGRCRRGRIVTGVAACRRTGRCTPSSVTIASISAAGVTSKAGLRAANRPVTSSAARSSIGIVSPLEVAGSRVEVGATTTRGMPWCSREHSKPVRADLVRRIAVRGDPVGAGDNDIDLVPRHQRLRPRRRRSPRAGCRAARAPTPSAARPGAAAASRRPTRARRGPAPTQRARRRPPCRSHPSPVLRRCNV